MRVINYTLGLIFCGFVACGGESDVDNPDGTNGSDAGEGGDSANPPPPSRGGDAGAPGQAGAAGEGAAPGSGGTTGGGAGTPPSMGAVGGGTPTPPAGGRPPTMPPPIAGSPGVPPDGCLLQSTSAGVGYCESFYTCSGGSGYMQVTCKDNGVGGGDCYCSSNAGAQQYQVSGTPSFATCESTAQLCLGGGPDPSVEEECTPTFTSNTASSCQLQERCTRAIDDSDTTIARTRSASCSGGDPVTCYCDYSGNQFRLDADSSEGACDTIIEHCDDPRVPPGGGPVTCEPRSQQSGMGYCSLYEECLSETDIGDGISAVSIEGRNATCQTSASGGSVCTCQGSSVAVQFEIDAAADGLVACQSASQICGDGGELQLEGETECLPQNQSASTTDCYASLDCTKQGSIGDQAVRVHGYLSLSCYAQGGAYSCTCSSGRESESLEVEADSAWAACSSAVAQCPTLVEPSFDGGVGSGGVGGIPMPGLPAGGKF